MNLRSISRVIKRDALSLVTNMTGLSLGLAASILLTVFIQYELSFDRHFSMASRIFRLNIIWIEDGEREIMPINLREAYTEIPEQVSGIESTVQIYRGWEREVTSGQNRYKGIELLYADPEFFHLFDFNFLQGNPEHALSEPGSVVITEEIALRIYGSSQVLGKSFEMGNTPDKIIGESVVMHSNPLEVLGVVENFLYQSAANQIEPLVLITYSEQIRNLCIRINSKTDPRDILRSVNETLNSFDDGYIMVNRFASDIYAGYYVGEERLRTILGTGSLLSILIVLLGIYALVSHNILSRTKEMGIRKVMGGSTAGMMTLIYGPTLKWTAIASLIAVPFSWLYLNCWLNDYTLRIPLYWWIFVSSVTLVIFFQTLITLVQTWKTARKNPVVALRYE